MSDIPNPETSEHLIHPNLELYEKLRRIDPAHTKPFQREGGFRGTAIKPAFQELVMTETFGPIGFGWGMTKPEYELVRTDKEILVYCTIGLWYLRGGVKSELFWGEGGDKIQRVKANGDVSTDDEGRKKSLTDAIGNAMKRIGMAADIYLNLWEDSKYKEGNEKFFSIKNNPDLQPPAIEKFETDVREKLGACKTLQDIDDLWHSGINARIREIGAVDKVAQNRMISAFSQKKNEIMKRDRENDGAGSPPPPPRAAPKPTPSLGAEVVPIQPDRPQARSEEPENEEAEPPHADVPDDLTPEKILQFEAWSISKLEKITDQKSFNKLWSDGADQRLKWILPLDKAAYDRIKGLYAARQADIKSGKAKAPDARVLDGSAERRQSR